MLKHACYIFSILCFSAHPTLAAESLTLVEVKTQGVDGLVGLDNLFPVSQSPDGRHLYASSGFPENRLTVFEVDEQSGAITFVESLEDGVGGVEGLGDVAISVVSPDGQHLYVAANDDNSVAAFHRNSVSGELSFIEVEEEGVGGVTGLTGAIGTAVSPDGKSVYVASLGGDSIAVFSRDLLTGELAFVEAHVDDQIGVDGLDGVRWVAVSRDGKNVYATSIVDHSIVTFNREMSGALQFVEAIFDNDPGIDGLFWASSAALTPDDGHLVVTAIFEHKISIWSRNVSTGLLTLEQVLEDGVGGNEGLNGAIHSSVSPDGSTIYVAGSLDNALSVFDRNPTTGFVSFSNVYPDEVGGLTTLGSTNGATVSQNGRTVYVTGNSDDSLNVFSTGLLEFVENEQDGFGGVQGLSQPIGLTISPDGKHLYAAGFRADSVTIFRRDSADGTVTYADRVQDGVGGVDGLNGAIVATASPDGVHVYIGGHLDNAIAVFSRDSVTGLLAFVEAEFGGVGGVTGIGGIRAIVVSADGSHLYAAGDEDNAVAFFSRDSATGEISFQEAYVDGVDGFDGLEGGSALSLGPGGLQLYATGFSESAIAVLSRDPSSGILSPLDVVRDGDVGIVDMDNPVDLIATADGRNVYVAARPAAGHSLVSLERFSNGQLTFEEALTHGSSADGLDGIVRLTIDRPEVYVFTTAYGENSVGAFARNRETTHLSRVDVLVDDEEGANLLMGARGLVASPDGHHLYVVSDIDDSLTVFDLVRLPIFADGFESGDISVWSSSSP